MEHHKDELGQFFEAYRNALPDPEPGAGFTPGLWRRIEARRRESTLAAAFARRIFALGAAAGLAAVLISVIPGGGAPANDYVGASYMEELATPQPHEPEILLADRL